MPNSTDTPNTGLSDLWDDLSFYRQVWFHKTTRSGYELIHILDENGRELARRLNSSGEWEWRVHSPERWYPLPDDVVVFDFEGDEEIDCFNLDILDSAIPGMFRDTQV